jgi:hypothetical protein
LKYKLLILLISVLSAFGAEAFSDEADDISTCKRSAKLYGGIELDYYSIRYDGGFFSSDVYWTGKNTAKCTVVGNKVEYLKIDNKTIIIDQFSGMNAKAEYERLVREVQSTKRKMETFEDRLDSFLKIAKSDLQRPKIEIPEIRKKHSTLLDPIRVRINGTPQQIAEEFSSDEAVKNLREQITEKNTEIVTLKKSLVNLERLESELARIKAPIEPKIAQLNSLISAEQFEKAQTLLSELSGNPKFTDKIKKEIEVQALKTAKPIPSKEAGRNLKAYEFLLLLRPESQAYKEKQLKYLAKLQDKKITAELQIYIEAIKKSSDAKKYKTKMAMAAKQLALSNKCTINEISGFGGWAKSTSRPGMYFVDCGGTRHWFNPSQKKVEVTTSQHVSETAAQKGCMKAVRSELGSAASFKTFDSSYTKHIKGSVTYRQGFTIKNAFGTKVHYYADCLIQSDRTFELNIFMR